MKFIKKNVLFMLLFTLILSVSNITTVLADSDYLQKGMTEEQKAMHEYNVKMFNEIKGNVDEQSAKIKEQVQHQQQMSSAEDIHKDREKIKSISTMILIIAPIFWITVIVIIIFAIRHFLRKGRTKITYK